ncbi:MAG: hypothetical protein N3F66_07235 [Spirochaetes bacterium]|nr:hypothetical protein [Spirochaetota bacterium]
MTHSPWLPFCYQYGIFTVFFIFTTTVAIKKQVISISHPTERRILFEIIAGYLFFIIFHASMIILAGV